MEGSGLSGQEEQTESGEMGEEMRKQGPAVPVNPMEK